MNRKKVISIIIIIAILFSMVGVLAQGNQYVATEKVSKQELETVQNAFQNRYQFNCSGECEYSGFGQNVKLQVQEKIMLFPKIENLPIQLNLKDEYILDEDGKILESKHNIWSRFMNNINRRNYL